MYETVSRAAVRYDLTNRMRGARVIYDGLANLRPIPIAPGATLRGVDLSDSAANRIRREGELQISEVDPPVSVAAVDGQKPPLVVVGMWGIGDNLHQRAVVRELMKTRDVWLETCHYLLYHDLVKQGLKLLFRPTSLRAQAKTIARERGMFPRSPEPPRSARRIKLWYHRKEIERDGSIVETMMAEGGVGGVKPDFSLPIPPEWRTAALQLISRWEMKGKPLMVYRPIVLRNEWNGAMRNPDESAYAALFQRIRDLFFVVSIADLEPGKESIVGPEQDADVKLHRGELDFQTMAALFAESALFFGNAGFGPVLAQAVGTPLVVVYGGRESYLTTERGGAHLAPTLGINPDRPCDQHNDCKRDVTVKTPNAGICPCDKTITLEPAFARLDDFLAKHIRGKANTLIFGTAYVDSDHRVALMGYWITLTEALNPDCDLLIVDSASPRMKEVAGISSFLPYVGTARAKRRIFDFGDNVGHLSRRGRDGWGRAFCYGLQAAIDGGYEYVAHIEGDSLFRLPVRDVIIEMARDKTKVVSTPVIGTDRSWPAWLETGLMFFSVDYLRTCNFAQKYDWPSRPVAPTPEVVVRQIVSANLKMMGWRAWRGDKNQISRDNVEALDLDWVTHCHSDIEVYSRFLRKALSGREVMRNDVGPDQAVDRTRSDLVASPAVKLNFGCGSNKLDGWRNMDAEIDIEKPLPFESNSADAIFSEHCIEHVDYYAAIRFFEEAFRVLKSGGLIRITVPSLEQIMDNGDEEYWRFTTKWQTIGATRRGAMHAILYAHGHKTAWTASLLCATLCYAGFEKLARQAPGQSDFAVLRGLEGHGKVIGEKFNAIESLCFEGIKPDGIRHENLGGEVSKAILPAQAAAVIEPISERAGGIRSVQTLGEQRAAPLIFATTYVDSDASQAAIDQPLVFVDSAKVAVVIGGAASVIEEMAATDALLAGTGVTPTYFVINDMIPRFERPCLAISLHPQKLAVWLEERKAAGFPDPGQVWAHVKHKSYPAVTHSTEDWRGSSGLFAIAVARQLGFERIILCGVPMTALAGHVVRGPALWRPAEQFLGGWRIRKVSIAPYVRSWSGWTEQAFGRPALDFLEVGA